MRTWENFSKPFFIAIGLFCFLVFAFSPVAVAQDVPVYKVDPFWPKPLPHKWSTQQFVDIYVSKDDHIWAINRSVDARPDELGAALNPPQGECCIVGPEILEFDADGNVLKAWGGPNYAPGWPGRLQTLTVDQEENVWISGTRPGDSVIKFSRDGKLLWDLGHRAPKSQVQGTTDEIRERQQDNQQTETFFGGIDAFDLDESAHEIYINDGSPNKRVLVYDMNTGAFKRGWGGHGIPLSEIDNDPPPPYDISGPPPDLKQFVPTLHCIHIAVDGLVYVCERGSDRIQVFTKQGKFVTSFFVHPSTPARGKTCGGIWHATLPMCGTVFNMTFSHDPKQKYLLVADGTNDMVWILNRSDGKQVGSFGGNGHYAGQLHWIDAIAMDSKGNLYTGEVEDGKRIQKFILTNGDGKSTEPHPTTFYK
jgi:hypothetical protein